MKKIIALSTLLALGALGMACGGDVANTVANKAANSANAAANQVANAVKEVSNQMANGTNTTKEASNTAPATTSKTEIGVPACDEYFTKLDEYLSNPKVPEAVKTQYQKSREDNLKAWKAAAATEAGKKGLETGCKAATDALKNLPKM